MKKKKKKTLQTFLLLGLAALVLTGLGFQQVEKPSEKKQAQLDFTEAYSENLRSQLDQPVPGETGAAEETRPVYEIPELSGPAPLPDPECYGEISSPEELQQLLERAGEVLEGQSLYLTSETELLPGSTVKYYLDDTIFAVTWKQKVESTCFTFAEVKLMHPSQFRRHLSGEEFGSGTLALTSEMSQSVNAVVGCSADYYSYRRRGLIIVDGEAKKYVPGLPDTCYVNRQGDLILERDQEFADLEAVQAYADENDILFSLSFGPILVKDGENVCPGYYDLGEVKQKYSRAALCQMDRLHYLYIAAGTDVDAYGLMTMRTFSGHVAETGCRQAYALDGGQTTTIVLNNQVVNHVNFGSERRISDIIYFATAIDRGA